MHKKIFFKILFLVLFSILLFFLLSNYSKKLQKIQTEENRVEVNNFSENTENKKEDFLNKSETVLNLPTSLISFVENLNIEKENFSVNAPTNLGEKYKVVKVIDGDTVDVLINGKTERLRLIGINTPETLDPRKPVECFGVEASNKAKELLTDKYVFLESDPSQGERDKYERLLRYVFLENGESFNLKMIKEGFAHEYTYDLPYKYQKEYKEAEKNARENTLGLWGDICADYTENAKTYDENSCSIKGNINTSGEKIYHLPFCASYEKTVISETAGERYFCTEEEALSFGWRRALNCD